VASVVPGPGVPPLICRRAGLAAAAAAHLPDWRERVAPHVLRHLYDFSSDATTGASASHGPHAGVASCSSLRSWACRAALGMNLTPRCPMLALSQ
jgi:hypothetical protein